MKYYFTLSKENVKNFYSSNWVILEEARVFGGAVVIKTLNNINKLFRCNLLRSSDTRTLFEIDLSEDDVYTSVVSKPGYITLVKLTNDKNIKPLLCTSLHYTTEFFDLTPNGYSLKGMLPITTPGWSWDIKPFSMKTTVDSKRDFIPHYSIEDSKINRLEILKEMSMFESDKRVRIPEIKKVIFNYPVTVVLWTDGTKTIVRYDPDKEKIGFDKEKAVAMCFVKKIYKDKFKSHWLDSISKAIVEAPFNSPDIDVLERMAAKRVAEKKVKELQSEIQKLETKSLEEMNSKVEEKDEHKDASVKVSKNEVSEEYVEKIFDQAEKENKKWAVEANNKGKKNKMDKDTFLACIKEDLTIDEIAEMNSWDKRNVARMYYKLTGTHPEAKPNTYSELDALFENGVSVDAAARRTGFSKNIVAMRYAKLQNKNNKG